MMKIGITLAPLRQTRPQEYVVRFLFGGASTVIAALIAQHWGPVIGGLFLAFPAIFPAGATLIEDREKERMAKIGADGAIRGRLAAAIDAFGAAIGTIGLIAFATILWKLLPTHNAAAVIACAAVAWLAVSCALWSLSYRRHSKPAHPAS